VETETLAFDTAWLGALVRHVETDPAGFALQVGIYALVALAVYGLLQLLAGRWVASTLKSIDGRELWDDERKANERERILLLRRYLRNLDVALAIFLFFGLFAVAYEVPVLSALALRVRDWFLAGGIASLLRIALILFIASFALRLIRKATKAMVPVGGKSLERSVARAATIRSVIESTVQIAVGAIVVIYILAELGANITSLIAGIGILGLAISFGAQSLVKDVISGFFILVEDQYGVGDVVQIAGLAGLVEAVNLRITTLRDIEGRVHIIPNGQVDKATIMTKGWSRSVLDIDVAYKTDLDQALEVLRDEATKLFEDGEWAWRMVDPPEVLGVEAFGDSGIRLRLLFKTLPREQWTVGREFRRRIKARFDREGIEIPFPHVTFYWGDEQMPKAFARDK
jgi:small conductance mechanosensitive channel